MRIDKSPRGPVTSFLRRRAALSALADIGWRVALVIALMGVVLLVHWFERHSLRDGVDGDISYIDILYFTTVTITTVGYGDIVPVTPTTRLFDAVIVTPIRIFVCLCFWGTASTSVISNSFESCDRASSKNNKKKNI